MSVEFCWLSDIWRNKYSVSRRSIAPIFSSLFSTWLSRIVRITFIIVWSWEELCLYNVRGFVCFLFPHWYGYVGSLCVLILLLVNNLLYQGQRFFFSPSPPYTVPDTISYWPRKKGSIICCMRDSVFSLVGLDYIKVSISDNESLLSVDLYPFSSYSIIFGYLFLHLTCWPCFLFLYTV